MKAYKLLSEESKWTKNYLARDKENNPVAPRSKRAVKWCAIGAIEKCYGIHTKKESEIYLKLKNKIKTIPATWNDYTDYQTVYNTLKQLDI